MTASVGVKDGFSKFPRVIGWFFDLKEGIGHLEYQTTGLHWQRNAVPCRVLAISVPDHVFIS